MLKKYTQLAWPEYFLGRLMTKSEVQRTWIQYQLEDQIKLDDLFNRLNTIPALIKKDGNSLCQRCYCQDSQAYYPLPLKNSYYCLNCLAMGRLTTQDQLFYLPNEKEIEVICHESVLTWSGKLSQQQEEASKEALRSFSDFKRPHLIHAVTGAGKTEMLFPLIDHILMKKGKVAIVSPRVDVCIELFPRLQQAFQKSSLLLLHGHSQETYRPCDILIATTHQLLRFLQAFDLLIVDEVDAFPYVDDASLYYAVNRAVKTKGKLLFLTATPDWRIEQALDKGQMTRTILPARFHGYPLPVPSFVWLGDWKVAIQTCDNKSRLLFYLKNFLSLDGRKLIFMANIQLAIDLFDWLSEFISKENLAYVYASDPQRYDKVQALRDGNLECLISTTILERGVTFEQCQVFILGAEDSLFSKSALVQMSGRVGRKKTFPTGALYYGHFGVSQAMKAAKREICQMNQLAKGRGLINV